MEIMFFSLVAALYGVYRVGMWHELNSNSSSAFWPQKYLSDIMEDK